MLLDVIITAGITLQFRDILTGSTKYQGVDGYFYDVVFNIGILTVTNELPSQTVQRLGIFASNDNSNDASYKALVSA